VNAPGNPAGSGWSRRGSKESPVCLRARPVGRPPVAARGERWRPFGRWRVACPRPFFTPWSLGSGNQERPPIRAPPVRLPPAAAGWPGSMRPPQGAAPAADQSKSPSGAAGRPAERPQAAQGRSGLAPAGPAAGRLRQCPRGRCGRALGPAGAFPNWHGPNRRPWGPGGSRRAPAAHPDTERDYSFMQGGARHSCPSVPERPAGGWTEARNAPANDPGFPHKPAINSAAAPEPPQRG
jgi:hypothetical protein